MRAKLSGTTLADGETIEFRGAHYFSPDDVNWKAIRPSDTTKFHPLVGRAGFYHLMVEGHMITDGAMVYERPFNRARRVRNMITFTKGVEIVEAAEGSSHAADA